MLSKEESTNLSNEITQTMASGLTSRDLLLALLAIIATDRYTTGGTPTEPPEGVHLPADGPSGRRDRNDKDDKHKSPPSRSVFPPR